MKADFPIVKLFGVTGNKKTNMAQGCVESGKPQINMDQM